DVENPPCAESPFLGLGHSGCSQSNHEPACPAHRDAHAPGRGPLVDDVVAWLNAHTGGPQPPAAAPAADLRERHPRSATALTALRYARNVDADAGRNLFAFGLRNRAFLGSSLRWCLGLDAGIRIGRNTRYWDDVTAGGGAYVGATFRQVM